MSALLVELREKALELSLEERHALVDDLIESLENEPPSKVEEAWMKEIEKRDRENQEGIVEPISHDQLFKELHQELNW